MKETLYIETFEMKNDPIVKKVRKTREEIFSRFIDDPEGFVTYLKEREEQYPDRLVTRRPRADLKR